MIEFRTSYSNSEKIASTSQFSWYPVTCICTVCMKSTIVMEMITLARSIRFKSENYKSVITFVLVYNVTRYDNDY